MALEIKANVSLEPIQVTAQVKAPTVNIMDNMVVGGTQPTDKNSIWMEVKK